MGVYIKGMEMPKSCPCELHGIGYDMSCSFAGGIPKRVREYYECSQNGARPLWCPIVPVPPHGRCVDADKLIQEMRLFIKENMLSRDDARELLETIESAPTVIEAEEGE